MTGQFPMETVANDKPPFQVEKKREGELWQQKREVD